MMLSLSSLVRSSLRTGRQLFRPAPNAVSLAARASACAFSSSGGNLEKMKLDPPTGHLFDKILVANRGEIAVRVMKTAKQLGIKTVAVYSEADAEAKHVKMADEAVCIGPAASSESYLRIDKIIDAMKTTGAQAVHPGYGFLSENAHFADAVEAAGLVFIGPSGESMRLMGDKISSKKIAKDAGVSTIPGYLGILEDENDAVKIANEVGYPVMIKASAGGGGKGMRIAWNDREAREGFKLSKAEAKSSFGDDRIFIERYIKEPRHVEMQIIADGFGNTCWIAERECSIQRRNQKVIEEAPSVVLTEETRRRMGDQAVALARACGYRSAGTVEFLVDAENPTDFFFLEMNTRLQVEHPITELISGLDLVDLMIRVAAGRHLPFQQGDIKFEGHAVESRVYAENPLRNFLPSIGRLTSYAEPSFDTQPPTTVRCDSGIYEGAEISMYYDPMISKLCTYAEDRQTAINAMNKALDSYVIRGVKHNVPILRSILDAPRFQGGNITTKYIGEEYPDGFKGYSLKHEQLRELATCAIAFRMVDDDALSTISEEAPRLGDSESVAVTIRAGGALEKDVTLLANVYGDGSALTVSFEEENGQEPVEFVLEDMEKSKSGLAQFILNGEELFMQMLGRRPLGYHLQHCGSEVDVKSRREHELQKHMIAKPKIDTSNLLMSPMPGEVVSVDVKVGDVVEAEQDLVVLNAMKMQNILKAERRALVKAVHVLPSSSVAVDQVMVEFEFEFDDKRVEELKHKAQEVKPQQA